ncbi:hypothetical protein OEZ85_011928 [Tetradesmus obliquus]|uniref:Tbc2 translation factor, chloroplastic n=1 Tax=Tetradesmus obliquus TaxID=3088 RepID=A0ABY8TU82_TETOB|nr:hypothetical protein OEZ85_011928 [Tetradesmus obliquus]
MISHALAKVGLQDQQLLSRIVWATGPEGELLNRLDAQQLCNLIWSVAVCVDAVNGVTAAYMAQDVTPGSSSSSSSSRPSPLQQYELPRAWLGVVSRAFQYKISGYSSAGLTMALWGLCRLRLAPGRWLKAFFEASGSQLGQFSRQELAVVAYALGKMRAEIPPQWLSQYLAASTEGLTQLSSQELSMSLWGLATCGAAPHKAWLMAWFLSSRASMQRASTQDLSLWLYSLALLRLTPSPLWCTSYVEASFAPLTARSTHPQELVNVMWAISCMEWSPPMLYWRGLLDAARSNFGRFNAQDLANCISAATAVDVSSIERPWLASFLQASEPKLPSFSSLQLAHTIAALAAVDKAHDWAATCIHAAWQEAFVQAAARQLGNRRFKSRALELVVHGLRQVHFSSSPQPQQEFMRRAEALLEHMKRAQQDGQQQQQQQQQQPEPGQPTPAAWLPQEEE